MEWSAIGEGTDARVLTLADHGGRLFAGGDFASAGGMAASHVALWDGIAWGPLGAGTDAAVFALASYRDDLIVGGAFTRAGTANANAIARWDGAAWSALDLGADGPVHSLTVWRDRLYAGGAFTQGIACWDGITWEGLAAGVDSTVLAIGAFDQDWGAGITERHGLVVGGDLRAAGETPAFHLALWEPEVRASSVPDPPASLRPDLWIASVSAGGASIEYWLPRATRIELVIHDVTGRRIATLAHGAHSAGWQSARWQPDAGSGIYWARLRTGNGIAAGKILWLN